jgi:hypothetical protein
MDIDFDKYYQLQAGSGINHGFEGTVYPIGNGWGSILSYLPKALKFIGKYGLSGLKTFGEDVINGKDISSAGTNALASTAQQIIDDANTKLAKFKTMKGKGITRKRKRRSVKKAPPKKRAKRKITKRKPVKRKKKLYKVPISSNNYI